MCRELIKFQLILEPREFIDKNTNKNKYKKKKNKNL